MLPVADSLQAQTGSIRLEGTVRDPSGSNLSDALLTAVEESTGFQYETASNQEGYYSFPALMPGIYTVTAKTEDFEDVVHRRIYLFVPGSTIENFIFEISAIDNEIGPDERLRIVESSTATSFSRQHIESLPLWNRDPLELLAYQPGVQIKGGMETESTVNGTRLGMNTIGMDGTAITNPTDPSSRFSLLKINPDSISNMQIITAGANAEYGRSAGLQTVISSRPGSQMWSGSLYDYFSNRSLNANDFFNNKSGIPRPGFNRHMFGATVGGPVSEKFLLFANYEGNRTAERTLRIRQVLTETAKAGVFRWYKPDDTVRDEETIRSFDIVANDPRGIGIDPTVASVISMLPDPNNDDIGDGLNTAGYSFDSPIRTNRDRIAARVDTSLNPGHDLFFRANWERTDATDQLNRADAAFPGGTSGTHYENNWGFAVGSNYVISPRTMNELRVSYLRPKTELKRPDRSSDPMFIANSWTNPLDPSFPRSYHHSIFEIADVVSTSRNLHSIRFGGSMRRTVQSSTDFSGAYPNVTFGTEQGNAPPGSIGPSEQSEISSADRLMFENLYNDLLGRMEHVDQTFYSGLTSTMPVGSARDRNFASMDFSGFIQDNWRILPNLTLNLGLRYELSTVPEEKDGFQSVLDQASELCCSANISNFNIVPGSNWYNRDSNNFAPRAGFAWDIFSSGALVLRGAYGMYYDRLIGGVTRFVDQNSYGFSQARSLYPNASGTDIRLSDGIPLPEQPEIPVAQPPASRSSSIAVLDQSLQTPRVDHFNLKLQRRLWGAILEAGYVATRGKDLFQYVNLNQTKTTEDFLEAFKQIQEYRTMGTPVPPSNTLIKIFGSPMAVLDALGGSNFDFGFVGVAADTLDRDYYSNYEAAGISDFYLRNFTQFNQFLYGTNTAESWYDSLQVGVTKSTNNYNLRAYYTWSKSLDTISAEGTGFVTTSDSFQPKADKARSDFSRKHVLNVAFNYAIPFGRDRDSDLDIPKWADLALGGWNLGLLWIRESGAPFSVNSGSQNLYAGVASLTNFEGDRNIGSIRRIGSTIFWIHPEERALFSFPEAGELANSGRNSFTGPKYVNLDMVLHKNFWLDDMKSIQFRFETYNLFNSTRFALPNPDYFNPRFGVIDSSAGSARRLQMALKFQF